MRLLLQVFCLIGLVFFAGCKKVPQVKKPVQVYHLQDGRYCYPDRQKRVWYWLLTNKSNLDDPVFCSLKNTSTIPIKGYFWSTAFPNGLPAFPSQSEIIQVDQFHGTIPYEIVMGDDGNPKVDSEGSSVPPE